MLAASTRRPPAHSQARRTQASSCASRRRTALRARLARGGGLAAAPNANPNCVRGRYQNLIADPTCRRQQRVSVRGRHTATCGVHVHVHAHYGVNALPASCPPAPSLALPAAAEPTLRPRLPATATQPAHQPCPALTPSPSPARCPTAASPASPAGARTGRVSCRARCSARTVELELI